MKNNKKALISVIIYILAITFCLLIVFRGFLISSQQVRSHYTPTFERNENQSLRALNEGWQLSHENGTSERISLPCKISSQADSIKIVRDVSGLLSEGDILKLDNNRQGMIIYADSEKIYEVNTTALIKQLHFTDYQLIPIEHVKDIKTITIEFNHKVSSDYDLPAIYYGSYTTASNEIVSSDLYSILALSLLLIIFVVLIIILLVGFRNRRIDVRIIDLAVFVLLAIFWGSTDSYLAILTNVPQEVVGLICYVSIMMIPLPISHFVWVSCHKKYKILKYHSLICAINLIIQCICTSFGLFQLQNSFYTAHILVMALIVISLVVLYQSRKQQKSKDLDILYGGIITLAIMAFASMILYWRRGGIYYRNCLLTGVILFTMILFIYVVFLYIQKNHENELKMSEIRIYEHLSMFDELTGLPNRRSYEARMEEIENHISELSDAVLIMLDVNGLKIVNDQYGHNAGDDLIVAAAKVISRTYGKSGHCYRIGGDEFVVILTDLSVPMSTYDYVFDTEIHRFNQHSRWKLSIAKGISHLFKTTGQRLNISDWKQEADVNMYRNKVCMTGGDTRDRAKDFRDIINCIITTVEAKDVYTAAHSDRVRELSYCIAKNLGVSNSTLQNLEIAAHLHDIGKIGIPDYILMKSSRLTSEEYEIIKKHSDIGAGIIAQAKGMREISDIVLHHHERWDGKGYPSGLSKEDIPLESRIIAIADSIDAMTSKRVYRDSMSIDACRLEIERNASLMYDPAIVQIALQHWDDILDIIMMHPKRLIENIDIT